MTDETKTAYTFELHCGNCQERELVEIPMGTTVEEWKKTGVCPNCGCATLVSLPPKRAEPSLSNLRPSPYKDYPIPWNPYRRRKIPIWCVLKRAH